MNRIEHEPMTVDKTRFKRYQRAVRRPVSIRKVLDMLYPWICLGGSTAVFYLVVTLICGRG